MVGVMTNTRKFKVRLILACCIYGIAVAALAKLIGNSYLFAALSVVGWVILFGFFLK
jgi:hypothetical protein